ncbi:MULTISPECIES: class I SAM-dependent methyltransferase [Yersinia]|uniref:Mg-protoporphyrin IX methyl transferase n=1 Tax=Yersinia intermedia TaxID=631 RepID=A0A0T9MH66_YERIN|nr:MULTISPECIES: methyltransferase domain-containing protein [Yersinia]UYJ97980.1 SAM-dependent methyltransferase [Yersinia enterocolitica]CNG10355.1 Mg-protoporphyrin IX methyl transferase [Yersinia intermedia]CNI14314.1 Mg-protoporphyrin IX methyl transferase [Yersinia frederiksenii]
MKAVHSLGTPMTDEQYASHWSIESVNHNRLNDYDWMASFIDANSMILDAGCGNGLGCIAMLKKGCSVIAIEANEHLAMQAIENVQAAGFSTKLINLNSASFEEIESGVNFQILLGSLFSEHVNNVAKSFEFDYVTNWLFGASPYRAAEELKKSIVELDAGYAREYRENATIACQRLSKLSKNKECKLHYTLRSAYEKDTPKSIAIALFTDEQNELFFNSNMVKPENINLRKNNSMMSPSSSQMKYIATNPNSSIPSNIKPVIVSIVI